MRLSFRWSRPWASGSAHWPRTSSSVDGRFSWVSKGVRVASGDLKMQHILKHLTEPTGERQHPFGTRLCLQSLVCYTLVPADAEKGLREAPASTCFAAEGCADGRAVNGLRPPSAGLRRNQWCSFSVLPHHLHDHRPAGGAETVAGTLETGRSP